MIRQPPGPGTHAYDLPPDCLPTWLGRALNPRRPVSGGGVSKGYGRPGRPTGGKHSARRRASWRAYRARLALGKQTAGKGIGSGGK